MLGHGRALLIECVDYGSRLWRLSPIIVWVPGRRIAEVHRPCGRRDRGADGFRKPRVNPAITGERSPTTGVALSGYGAASTPPSTNRLMNGTQSG
ncbi:hypothetical protein GCM10009800_51010 [Nocardiopsis rhodophaea]